MSKYTVEGNVESMKRDGTGIKVNGVWYSSKYRINCNWKDDVKFTAEDVTKDGRTYNNFKGDLEVLSTNSNTVETKNSDGSTSTKQVTFPIGEHDRENCLARRHAFSAALEMLQYNAQEGQTVKFANVVDLAQEIVDWTTGHSGE